MDPGSALIFLASCYHGGGHNSTRDEVRRVHGLFFVRGTMRTEENQFLAVPRRGGIAAGAENLAVIGGSGRSSRPGRDRWRDDLSRDSPRDAAAGEDRWLAALQNHVVSVPGLSAANTPVLLHALSGRDAPTA